jgi:hypothetical protein
VNLIDPTGHKWSWGKFWKAAVAAVVSAVVFVATGGTATPVIAGFWAGMAGGAVSGALSGGGIKAVLTGAAFGAVTGALTGGLVAKFGGGFGLGLLAASGGYAAATGNLDSFAGGLLGGIATGMAMNAFKPNNAYGDIRMELPQDQRNDSLQAILNSIKDSPTAVIAAAQKVVAVANNTGKTITYNNDANLKGIWGEEFKRSFADGVLNSTYIDGGASLSAPGTLRPALRFGFRLSAHGLDGYYGFGLGSGSGASLTVNTRVGASNSITAGFSAKGGTGVYGYSLNGSVGSEGFSGSGGIGWGIGNGRSTGATHTIKILEY